MYAASQRLQQLGAGSVRNYSASSDTTTTLGKTSPRHFAGHAMMQSALPLSSHRSKAANRCPTREHAQCRGAKSGLSHTYVCVACADVRFTTPMTNFPKLHLSAKLGKPLGSVCMYESISAKHASRQLGVLYARQKH